MESPEISLHSEKGDNDLNDDEYGDEYNDDFEDDDFEDTGDETHEEVADRSTDRKELYEKKELVPRELSSAASGPLIESEDRVEGNGESRTVDSNTSRRDIQAHTATSEGFKFSDSNEEDKEDEETRRPQGEESKPQEKKEEVLKAIHIQYLKLNH